MAQKYSQDELKPQKLEDLLELAEDEGLKYTKKPTKAILLKDLLEVQTDEVAETEDDELDDDEVEEPADEVDDEEEDDELPSPDEDDELDEVLNDDEADDEVEETPKAKRSTRKKAEKPEANGEMLAAKQVATILGTEAKTLRQFFRSPASVTAKPVGSGGRYEFPKEQVPKIKEEFDAWRSAHAARGSKRTGTEGKTKGQRKAAIAAEIEEIESVEELSIDDLDDEVDDEELTLDDDEELDD